MQKGKIAAYLLKYILHMFPDAKCVEILTQLRNAANPDTKLLILDCLIPLACRAPKAEGDGFASREVVPGSIPRQAPIPLLPNYGVVNEMCYIMDIAVRVPFLTCYCGSSLY